nr:reverse transcriptase domain-containing protein [Tanacetum cinerariifolium]
MRTRSSSNFPVVSSNPSTSNPKCRNRRRSKQPFTLEESSVDTMVDQRTMAELLRAPTEGYAEAIVIPSILADQFELKHSLINMMTTDQFFRLEKDNPHNHIRWFNKITSTIKYKDVPNSAIKLMLFPFSLAGVARRWLEKEPPRSIHTWEDVSKFINDFFPTSRTTNLRNEISNFQQRFDESFHEAWDRYKDLLRACPHHGFTEFHQLDTFYNALNSADQDSLNAAAGENLLERRTQDVLTIIENKSKQTSAMTTAMTAMLKQFQATSPPASIKVVKETCVTCSGFNRGNNFNPEHSYQAPAQQNQNVHLNELEKVRRMNEANMKAMQTQIDMVKNKLRNEMKNSIQTSLSNQTNEIKNMMASLLQMNTTSTSGTGSLPSNTIANLKGELKAITTRSGLVIDGPTVPTPPQSINLEVDEHVEETFTDPDLAEYTIKKMLKALLSNKEKLQELANTPLNENCSAVILKKLPQKLGDPRKFLIPCGFSELKCKALADLGASINLMPLSVWKKLGLPELIPTRMTLELANRAICTPAGIARDVFVPVGKFTFPADFVIVDYESDPRVPLILRRPFLQTARALIDVHGEEMIFRDEGCNVLSEKLLDLDSTKDLHPPLHDNPLKIEFLLYQDKDSSLKDFIDQKNLANLAHIFVDAIPEMFTDEHALDYSSSLVFNEYDDDFLEVKSDAEKVYDDPFDSKGEKIKESKLLIDELDLPCDFLPPSEYDSFISQDFSRVDALPSTNNEDKIFNPVQTHGSGISILLALGTPSTSSGNLYCQWELSPSSGNALCILFPTILP